MAVFFKDFHKETKDLLGKNTAEGKPKKDQAVVGFAPLLWKVECKNKTKDGIVVNPVADENGVQFNVENVCNAGAVTAKAEVKQDLMKTKPTVSYSVSGRKVEVSLDSITAFKAWNLTFEDKQKAYTAIVKVNSKSASIEDSVPVAAGITAGGSIDVPFQGMNFQKWAAGVRYSCCKSTVCNVTTQALKSFQLGAATDIPGVALEGKPINVAVQVDYAMAAKKFKAVVGAAGKTPLCPCSSSWKAKIDSSFNVSLSHIVDVSGWKLATTFDLTQRAFGLLVTRE